MAAADTPWRPLGFAAIGADPLPVQQLGTASVTFAQSTASSVPVFIANNVLLLVETYR
jgi:hypothetical protein